MSSAPRARRRAKLGALAIDGEGDAADDEERLHGFEIVDDDQDVVEAFDGHMAPCVGSMPTVASQQA
jgi:hypothetical protein